MVNLFSKFQKDSNCFSIVSDYWMVTNTTDGTYFYYWVSIRSGAPWQLVSEDLRTNWLFFKSGTPSANNFEPPTSCNATSHFQSASFPNKFLNPLQKKYKFK